MKRKSIELKEMEHTEQLQRRLTDSMFRNKLVCDFLSDNESMTLDDYNRLCRAAEAATKKSLPKSAIRRKKL